MENERLADRIEKIHMENPDKGYRRLNDDLRHDYGIHVNDKRVLRICRVRDIRSTVKYNSHGCTRRAKKPQYIAENLLARQFHADKPNEKWLTDVTEFKWYEGITVHKLYLSAILGLYDRRIVSYALSDHNDNPLVYKTFDKAVRTNPDAHPLFHSDRGVQYTSRAFHHKLQKAGMTQSMSRVAHCIDNGPMEGFWGILNVNANQKMSIFGETKCNFSPDSTEVYTALIHHFTCRLEARQALIYQLVIRLDGRKRQV